VGDRSEDPEESKEVARGLRGIGGANELTLGRPLELLRAVVEWFPAKLVKRLLAGVKWAASFAPRDGGDILRAGGGPAFNGFGAVIGFVLELGQKKKKSIS